MARRVSSLLTWAVVIATCTGQQQRQRNANLNGNDLSATPLLASLAELSVGALEFLKDGQVYRTQEPPDTTPPSYSEFDFIVVGAGSAGAAIASRLSEIPDATVLLIEAGGSESLIMDIPLLVNYLQFSNDVNWKYQTEPSNSYCLGMTGRRCNWPRGKVMGGSSVLNYMIATRGHPKDYDRWAAMGNTGWSYQDVLPYFKKMETLGIPKLKKDSDQHGTNGPLYISYVPFRTPLAQSFMKAGYELGYYPVDYNAQDNNGISYLQVTIANGTRMSSSRAYLHPAKNRPNLFVTKRSLASKVIIDPETKRATGVEFIKHHKKYVVTARKEIILSAGTIGSPQLLMLSGVGHADHLIDMGIKIIKDAPVGDNLMDHIAYGGLSFLVDKPVGIITEDMINPINPYMKDYLTKRAGPITIPGSCEALLFLNVDDPNNHTSYPNVELLFQAASVVSDPVIRYGMGISDKLWTKTYASIEGRYSWSIFPMLLRPKSRGQIRLRDANINSHPKIVPNYMADPEDVKVLIRGIRATIAVSKTRAMQQYRSHLHDVPIAGCENYEPDSDLYWECATRTFTFNIYHYAGTCKMGPIGDPTAVVDPTLKVIGVKGLRVADASIMPEIPTGHTNIPSIMIGEKLADMVKEEWGYQTKPTR